MASLRTQIDSGSSAPAPSTGVKIPTCKFSLKETFLTSPEELYRVFLNQEVSWPGRILALPLQAAGHL